MAKRALCLLMSCAMMAPFCRAARPDTLWRISAATHVQLSTDEYSPYYIASRRGGLHTQGRAVMLTAYAGRELDFNRRFSWSIGAECGIGLQNAAKYLYHNAGKGNALYRKVTPKAGWINQLWGMVKWRSMALEVGMRDSYTGIFDSSAAPADYVISGNARPMAQLRAGFIRFVDVPLTRGWVQIKGDFAYGRFTDNGWLRNHFNYLDGFLTTGAWFHHKSLFLRSRPGCRVVATIGVRHAAQFGGTQHVYADGREVAVTRHPAGIKEFLKMIFQTQGKAEGVGGDEAYYVGNHVGAWNIKIDVATGAGLFSFGAQLPWEDGSGLGKRNGWDGIWTVEWQPSASVLKGVSFSYFDFTNQSGPIVWAPGDNPGTQITTPATGGDDYYNNYFFNGWSNYGMAIGTPLIKSPLYDSDGRLRFTDNRVRGFEAIAVAEPFSGVHLKGAMAWRTSIGTPWRPAIKRRSAFSMLAEGSWQLPRCPKLKIGLALAFDTGSLYNAGFGTLCSLTYTFISVKR